MTISDLKETIAGVLSRNDLNVLVVRLHESGFIVLGPKREARSIALGPIRSDQDLAAGWRLEAQAGSSRLVPRSDARVFACGIGAHSPKRWLFPPERELYSAEARDGGWRLHSAPLDPPKVAFIGLTACDLAALERLDDVFAGQEFGDPYYKVARQRCLTIGVDCAEPSQSCFCTSVGGSPVCARGFDLALTELLDSEGHRFLVRIGSDRGAELAAELPLTRPAKADIEAGTRQGLTAEGRVTKRLNSEGLPEALVQSAESQRWTDIANKCLACGNCTMSCPTCFCSTVEDQCSLCGQATCRMRQWDSCFNSEFSYIHGGSVRRTTMSRYRQWMTHKLSAWWEQFGKSGCVGCGRCTVWCPAAIDLVQEANAIKEEALAVRR